MGLKFLRDDLIYVYIFDFLGGFVLSEIGFKKFCKLCEEVVIGICVDGYVSI